MDYSHKSVLLSESIEGLNIKEGGTYVDATMGGGGHSLEICRRIGPNGTFIGIDQDPYAQKRAKERLEGTECRKYFVQDNFENLGEILESLGVEGIDGILYDLGVSSFQLDDGERGFSYHSDGPLDMRMDTTEGPTAADIVNGYSQSELTDVIKRYGEERFAGRIARRIVEEREKAPITTTGRLSEIVKSAYPPNQRFKGKHPARKTFQALRIELNRELDILDGSFDQALDALKPGGRICVITFHSLEDRLVKRYFKHWEDPCTCPPEFPVCVCGNKPRLKAITRKPIAPGKDETEGNARARSAKLRVAQKLEEN